MSAAEPPLLRIHRWLEEAVMGLNLCPFAGASLRQGRLRLALARATSLEELDAELLSECERLESLPSGSTTLLVVPTLLRDYAQYLTQARHLEAVLERAPQGEHIQLVSFHPDYVGPGMQADSAECNAGRAPLPVLHLLRVQDLREAADKHPDVEGIPARNAKVLALLTAEQRERLFR